MTAYRGKVQTVEKLLQGKKVWSILELSFENYLLTVNTTPMKATTTKTYGKSKELGVWQISLKLSLLAGCFMATSYCFLITVKSIASLI